MISYDYDDYLRFANGDKELASGFKKTNSTSIEEYFEFQIEIQNNCEKHARRTITLAFDDVETITKSSIENGDGDPQIENGKVRDEIIKEVLFWLVIQEEFGILRERYKDEYLLAKMKG